MNEEERERFEQEATDRLRQRIYGGAAGVSDDEVMRRHRFTCQVCQRTYGIDDYERNPTCPDCGSMSCVDVLDPWTGLEPEPKRAEHFAPAFQRAVEAYWTTARTCYMVINGIGSGDVERLRALKDTARIELETVAQDVLRAIATERGELNRWINGHAPFGLSPTGDTLDSETFGRWSKSVDRLEHLDDLEAFLGEHGLTLVPDE